MRILSTLAALAFTPLALGNNVTLVVYAESG